MEENDREIEAEQTADGFYPEQSPLEMAEELISLGSLDKAQTVLDNVKEKSGKKFYVQSRLYKERCWYNEQRKCLKSAVKAEPDNEEYKKELAELEEFSKTNEYKSAVRKKQMGDMGGACAEGCGEVCCEGFCYCICTGICEGIGNGC